MTNLDSTVTLPEEFRLSPSSSPALDDYQRRTLKHLRETLPVIAAQLTAVGVDQVIVQYDGCGDSGQIESVAFEDAAHHAVMTPALSTLQADIESLLFALIDVRAPGWENNDGGSGAFIWRIATDELSHEHHHRFTDYTTDTYEGL